MNRIAAQIYQIIGLDFSSPLSSVSGGFRRKLIIFIHLIYVCGNFKLQYDFHKAIYHHPDFVGNTTNLIEMILPTLCHLTIVLESIASRSTDKKIKILEQEIQRVLKIRYQFKFKRFCWLFIVNSAIFVLVFALLSDYKGEMCWCVWGMLGLRNIFRYLLNFDYILFFFAYIPSLENSPISDCAIDSLYECIRFCSRNSNRFHQR